MRRLPILALLPMLLGACSTARYYAPVGTDPKVTWVCPHDFDATWQAVVEVFAETNTPIKTVEKDSGVIYAERPLAVEDFSSRFVDLGSIDETELVKVIAQPSDSWRDGRALVTYNVFVRRDGEKNELRVSTTWQGQIQRWSYDWWYGIWRYQMTHSLRGISTGLFESMLLQRIASKLGESTPDIQVVGGPSRNQMAAKTKQAATLGGGAPTDQ